MTPMPHDWAARVRTATGTTAAAGALWAMSVVAVIAGVATIRNGGPTTLPQAFVQATGALSSTTMGLALVARLRRNPIGWLLLVSGLANAIGLGATDVADFGLVAHPGAVPGAIWLAWVSNWTWTFVIIPLGWFVPLIFPTGHLPSRRWAIVVAIGVAALVAGTMSAALTPFTGGQFPNSVQNPLLVTGSAGNIIGVIGTGVTGAGLATLPFVAVSIILRFRHSSGIERQQYKWFTYVVLVIAPALIVGLILSGTYTGTLAVISNTAWTIALIGIGFLPVAIGIAVLRYRLYEIDRLISRTVAYALVGFTLAAVFAGAVLVLGAVLAPVTRSNELAVAGSTLLIAALFQPLRTRLQRIVDRRFNRARYDAERTVTAFAARLRDEIDTERLRSDLLATVEGSLEPTTVSLWLR